MRIPPDEIKNIAVFRALQLGDLLCAIPAVRAMKHAYPSANIMLIGMPWSESLVHRFPHYFNDFIHFPGYPGLPEQSFDAAAFTRFITQVNSCKFDLLLQMHGNGSIINPLMGAMGAKCVAGYREEGRYCPGEELFMTYPEGYPEIDRHLKLMEFLRIPLQGKHLELPVFEEEKDSYRQLCIEHALEPGRYVCIHPGARDTKRWWSPGSFARVADDIAGRGYHIVLTGTKIERETIEQVASLMRHPVVNLAGRTALGTLALLVKNARMLLSNDTGVSHIAAAMQTPSVVIFLASDPARWAPLNRELHRVVLPGEASVENVMTRTFRLLEEDAGLRA